MHLYPAAAAVVVLCVTVAGAHHRKPTVHSVVIESFRFNPEVLTVAPGDTIVWVNKDVVAHTATSKEGRFDSRLIPTGAEWRYTARRSGSFAYLCTLHPTMKGRVRVRSPSHRK